MKSLIIAAHPDDEILGVGGTILKRINEGNEVSVLIVCDCLSPRNVLEDIIRVRNITKEICHKMGVKNLFQLKLGTDTKERLDEIPFKKVIQEVQNVINEIRAEEVFTHNPSDWNTDHQIIFKATISATRTITNVGVKKIYCYEVPSSTEQAPNLYNYSFVPNKFVNISEFLEKKLNFLSLYKSEIYDFPHMRSIEAVKITAKLWGAKNGISAAEAFMVVRDIEM